METYDRYSKFRSEGKIRIVPNIVLSKKNSDYYEKYNPSNRLDLLSYKYYGDANYDWLIMTANPEYGSMEFNIPLNAEIRIPYPLENTIQEYEYKINKFFEYYG
jgi:hypothetical protein